MALTVVPYLTAASLLVEPTQMRPARPGGAGTAACAGVRRIDSALRNALLSVAVGGACLLGGSDAALAKELTPNQEIAAQAWLKTDRNFVDRTFGGQDWFAKRQAMVKKSYSGRDQVYDDIRAMLATLDDKYTRFLTPSMYDAVYSVATGDVAGIGVELAATGPKDASGVAAVSLASVVENAPSDQAGLREGDIVIEADGTNLRGLSPEEAASKVRGPVGSKLRLVIERAGEPEPLVKLITRAEVKLAAVTSSLESAGGEKVAFVRVKQFSTTTAADVRRELDALVGKGATAFVLDVRGNTGGYFPGGVDLARLFLRAEAKITDVVDNRQQKTAYTAFEDGAFASGRVVVLVDEKTASASEIFSSAMQDNGRATLVGTPRTFGKAVIQTVTQLDDGSAVVVTMARYQTPKGTNINQKGIATDVTKECPKAPTAAVACVAEVLKS